MPIPHLNLDDEDLIDLTCDDSDIEVLDMGYACVFDLTCEDHDEGKFENVEAIDLTGEDENET